MDAISPHLERLINLNLFTFALFNLHNIIISGTRMYLLCKFNRNTIVECNKYGKSLVEIDVKQSWF